MRCAVFGCNVDDQAKHFKKGEVMFFRFPTESTISRAWQHACGRKDGFNSTNARVCSKHFSDCDYARSLKQELLGYTTKNRRLIKPGVVPTKNLPKKMISTDSSTCARDQRLAKRNRCSLVDELLKEEEIYIDGNAGEPEGAVLVTIEEGPNILTRSTGTNTEVDDRDEIISELKCKIAQLESEAEVVKKFWTSGQIKKLKNPKGRPRWSVEDVSKAIAIHSAGPRAYRLLLKKGYPLPAVSTLRSWLKKIKISPGILKAVFNIIKRKELDNMQKVCILSFDEIKLRKIYLYDKSTDETLKPFSYAQVVMLRGLFANWKQPIFYDYDCKMTKEILFTIINYVEDSGFQIVGMVSDLGGGNRSLHKQLEITPEKPHFKNPANEHTIHVFADVPHLVKLIRNHFVDNGFIINGKEINKNVIEKLLDITSVSDLTITHKISKESLNVKNAQRQKVKLATKLFSHTISSAITRCGVWGQLEGENWLECAEFFKLVNDWFDCLNVRVPEADSRERMKAYGLSLEQQKSIINKMTDVTKNMRVKGRSFLLPFQTGIVITNTSLQLLFEDLAKRFGTKYILTYRLNQDVLENFFGAIRAKGGLHDHPDALEFKYRLRSYILGRNGGSFSAYGNVEEDNTPDLPIAEENLGAQCFASLVNMESQVEQLEDDQELKDLEDIVYDGLENLAGFICHKLKEPSSSLTSSTDTSYSWVDHLSEGGLTKPSPEYMKQMEQLEAIFNAVNSHGILISKNYLQNLLTKSTGVACCEATKKLFFRSRMFFRLRHLNKELTDTTISRKRKLNKLTK